jgi:hypothetical protein
LPVAERAVQHEAAVHLHRAAVEDRRAAERRVGQLDLDLLEQRGERHLDRAVDDDAERAVRVVLADERERVSEVRIGHGGMAIRKWCVRLTVAPISGAL